MKAAINGRRSNANKPLMLLLIGMLIVLIAVSSILYFMTKNGTEAFNTQGRIDQKLLKAAYYDQDQLLLATIDDMLMLGKVDKIDKELKFENAIQAIEVSPDKKTIFIGCADQKVYMLDQGLNVQDSFAVNGRIMDMALMDDGSLLVTYGIGEYSDKYYVGKFDVKGNAVYEFRTGFTTRAVDYLGQQAIYATVDARIGAISADGKALWEQTLNSPITRLMALRDANKIFASDERGNVYLLTDNGGVLWVKTLSQYPIQSLGWDKTKSIYFAGDQNGTLFMLDEEGNILYSKKLSEEGLSEILPHKDGYMTVIGYSGDIIEADINAMLKEKTFDIVNKTRFTLNIILVLLAVIILILSIEKLRNKVVWIGKQLYQSRLAYMLLLPSFILLLIFNYYPTVTAALYSFADFTLTSPMKFVGFQNYVAMMHDQYFWIGIGNMIRILLTSFAKDLTMPLLVAELIFWLRNERHKYLLRTAFVIPSIVPGVVTVLLWKMMYDPEIGLINNVLGSIGLEHLQRAWLGDEKLAIWSIIFAGVPWITTFAFLVYFGGLINISRDIYDSARIDGINAWNRFWHIDVPMIKPQFKLILFFSYIGSIQTFANIWIFTQGGPGSATYVPALQMYIQISKGANFGYASALGMVLFIFILIGTILNFRFGKED